MNGFLRGALAGAAGTTALNATTYADMALRARPASSTPEKMVKKVSDAARIDIPGQGDSEENRVQGLAPLLGIGVGTGAGAVAGLVHELLVNRGHRLPFLVEAVLLGALAMAASDLPMAATGVSSPKTWSAKDWLSDAVPHLAYGLVTASSLRLTETTCFGPAAQDARSVDYVIMT